MRTAPCLVLGLMPLAAAQMAASGAEDTSALRGAKAAADTSACGIGESLGVEGCPLDSWRGRQDGPTGPCGEGYDDVFTGWVSVKCDGPDGRVVWVGLVGKHVGGNLLPFFGRLGALLVLQLASNPALSGKLTDLVGATELRYLDLHDCPLVVGDVAALAALVHLGEEYTLPDGYGGTSTSTGRLHLRSTGVHGPVAALRALPGLGSDWGPDCVTCSKDYSSWASFTFTPCSAFQGCGALFLAPIAVTNPEPLFNAFTRAVSRRARSPLMSQS